MLILYLFPNTNHLARLQQSHRGYCPSSTPTRTWVWTEDLGTMIDKPYKPIPGIFNSDAPFLNDKDSTTQVCWQLALSFRVWIAGKTYMARHL